MGVKQYVGARYVPKFHQNSAQTTDITWEANTAYEALTIVGYNGASYTSKIPVPNTVGNPADNPTYWALTGNYNAQVELYRQEVQEYSGNVTNLNNEITTKENNWRGKYINALENGIKNDGSDQTDAINALLESMPSKSILFFPAGRYGVTSITVPDSKGIEGQVSISTQYYYRDQEVTFYYIGSGNETVVSVGYNCWVKNIGIQCNAYYVGQLSDTVIAEKSSTNPGHTKYVRTDLEGVNGLVCTGNSMLGEHIYVNGASGTGINVGCFARVININACQCNIGINLGLDSSVVLAEAILCSTGVYCPRNGYIQARIDQCYEYGIRCVGKEGGVTGNITADGCDYAGISAESSFNNFTGSISRCGRYYAGYQNESVSTEMEPFASNVYLNSYNNFVGSSTTGAISDTYTGLSSPARTLTVVNSTVINSNYYDDKTKIRGNGMILHDGYISTDISTDLYKRTEHTVTIADTVTGDLKLITVREWCKVLGDIVISEQVGQGHNYVIGRVTDIAHSTYNFSDYFTADDGTICNLSFRNNTIILFPVSGTLAANTKCHFASTLIF